MSLQDYIDSLKSHEIERGYKDEHEFCAVVAAVCFALILIICFGVIFYKAILIMF